MVNEIKQVLGENVEYETIERELKLFFSYGVEIQEAKRGVIKKLGSSQSSKLAGGVNGLDKNLKDVKDGDGNINIKVKIISHDTKTVTVDGAEKQIYYGILADETMSIPFTAWNDFQLEKDAVVNVKGAYVKSFRSELQINFGNNTVVEQLDSGELSGLTPERIAEYQRNKDVKIGLLKPGISNIVVTGRVLEVQPKEVMVKGEPKTVYSGSLGDETGKVQFSAWHDFKLKQGDAVKISNCYVRNWRGIPQLSFDQKSDVEFVENHSIPELDNISSGPLRKLIEFEELGGGYDINFEGIVLELRPGTGLISRCNQCKRVLQDNNCATHGAQVNSEKDLRVKAIVDDGSGSIMVVIGGDLTSTLINTSKEEYKEQAENSEFSEKILEKIKDSMLMERFSFRGNVTQDNFGMMMIVKDFSLIEPDVKMEAQMLLNRTGGI